MCFYFIYLLCFTVRITHAEYGARLSVSRSELEGISDDVVQKIQVMLFEHELHLQQCEAKQLYFYSSFPQQF